MAPAVDLVERVSCLDPTLDVVFKLLLDQLRQGDGYDRLTPTAGVIWLAEPLIAIPPRFHSIFELRERHTHTRLSDQLVIHLLQLSCLPGKRRSRPSRYTATAERWGRFLAAKDDTERRWLASHDPIMAIAHHTLEQLSQDPRARRLAREREDEIKLFEIERAVELAASRAEGEAK
ncbi:MAG: PD-(D/E)XK nuclease family transposase, partial [Myxococcales bacterium]|nr:PD-(D/E)XK nuclease family transposase [Myxococcales bacterium]